MGKRKVLLSSIPMYKNTHEVRGYGYISFGSDKLDTVKPFTVTIESDTPEGEPDTVEDVMKAVEVAARQAIEMTDRIVGVQSRLAQSGQLTKRVWDEYQKMLTSRPIMLE
jgi:hypothetical protein